MRRLVQRLFARELTTDQKVGHLHDSGWATERQWALLNPLQYRLPFRNRLIFNTVFGGRGFPVPRLLGIYDPKLGYAPGGRPLRSAADLRECLEAYGGDGLVFKPLWARAGLPVLVLGSRAADDAGTFLTPSGERYDAERLARLVGSMGKEKRAGADEAQSYLLEELIRPHPMVAELSGPTLGCVRVVTMIGLQGVPRILGAIYRVQPKPTGAGRPSLEAAANRVDYTAVTPGTDGALPGVQLPQWAEVRQLALKAAAVFPWARAIAWDITISDRGPVLIQGNADWSTSLLKIPDPHGLMTDELRTLCNTLDAGRKTPPSSPEAGTTS